MDRIAAFVYGVIALVVLLATAVYAIGFVGFALVPPDYTEQVRAVVPNALDSDRGKQVVEAAVIDLALIVMVAVQQLVMSRRGVRQLLPQSIGRSTYVLISCLVLGVLFWQWRPIPEVVWDYMKIMEWFAAAGWVERKANMKLVEAAFYPPAAHRIVFQTLFAIGTVIAVVSALWGTLLELTGLGAAYANLRGRAHQPAAFGGALPSRIVRHPVLLGVLIMLWATPTMTFAHFLFSAAMSLFLWVGITVQERELAATHGEAYREYLSRTPMLIPLTRWKKSAAKATAGPEAG
ncbi:MAG: methyltransferase family protein [Pirellulales bacterium]